MFTSQEVETNRRASAVHALKSGITAKAQVIPGEDPAELDAIAAAYHGDWQPATSLERFLIDSLVRADWLLQRFARVEAPTLGPSHPERSHLRLPQTG